MFSKLLSYFFGSWDAQSIASPPIDKERFAGSMAFLLLNWDVEKI